MLIRHRRQREAVLGKDLFSEPAWDMLLDLFAAAIEGKRVSKSSLMIASAVPPSTALRWIDDLVEVGTLFTYPDARDGRRMFVGLCEPMFEQIARLMRHFREDCEREIRAGSNG